MKVIAIANLKGGSGKSTTAAILASIFAETRKVLAVDLDLAQANLTTLSGVEEDGGRALSAMFVKGTTPRPKASIWKGVSIVAGNPSCAALETSRDAGMIERFGKALHAVKGFDLAILDTAPSVGIGTIAAISAADLVLLPLVPSALDALGALRMLSVAKEIGKKMAICLVKTRKTRHAEEIEARARKEHGEKVLRASVPLSVAVEEALSHRQSVTAYAPRSKAALGYRAIAAELAEVIR